MKKSIPHSHVPAIKFIGYKQLVLTLKEPGGGGIPLDIFCYISAGCYFFALKLHDFFLRLALNVKGVAGRVFYLLINWPM